MVERKLCFQEPCLDAFKLQVGVILIKSLCTTFTILDNFHYMILIKKPFKLILLELKYVVFVEMFL